MDGPPDLGLRAEIEGLLTLQPTDLFVRLGERVKAEGRSPRPATPEVGELISRQDMRLYGREVFQEISRTAFSLLCGSASADKAERKRIAAAFDMGDAAIASYIAMGLISVAVPVSIAPVAGALAVKLFLKPTYRATCDYWGERL